MKLFSKCDKRYQDIIYRVIQILKENPCKDCDLKKLIEHEVELSWNTTRAVFRRFTGVTIMSMHNKFVLEESKRFLKNDQKCISIAVELGFNDEAYFSKWFKKHEGMSPLEFRNLQ